MNQSIIACGQTFNTAVTVKNTIHAKSFSLLLSFLIIEISLFCFFSPLNLQEDAYIGYHDGGEQKRV